MELFWDAPLLSKIIGESGKGIIAKYPSINVNRGLNTHLGTGKKASDKKFEKWQGALKALKHPIWLKNKSEESKGEKYLEKERKKVAK